MALTGPEALSFFATNDQGGRNIERHHFYIHISKNAFVKRQHQREIMELNKPATHAQPTQAFRGNSLGQDFRKHDERDTRNKTIDRGDAPFFQVTPHVLCGIVYDGYPLVVLKGNVQFFNENFIDLEDQQLRVRLHAVQDVVGNDAVAGAQFHDCSGPGGIYFSGNGAAQKTGTGRYASGRAQIPESLPKKIKPLLCHFCADWR